MKLANFGKLTAVLGSLHLVAGSPVLADSIVVRSTGPSSSEFAQGKKLASGAEIRLAAGDMLTVLDGAGTRVLRGPGRFKLDDRVVRDRSALAGLSRTLKDPPAVRAGAVRAAGASTYAMEGNKLPAGSIWLVDVDQGGKVCLPADTDLYLWRNQTADPQYMWLSEASGGGMVRLGWQPQTAGIAWPDKQVEPGVGHSYLLYPDGGEDNAVRIELVPLAEVPSDVAGLSQAFLDNGCVAQFERLADTLALMDMVEPEGGDAE